MVGYYGKKALTEKIKINGWIHTGDIAEIDEDGLLYIYGRANNAITLDDNTSLYIFDIELKLMEDAEVREAIVNGKLVTVSFKENSDGYKLWKSRL